VEIATPTITFLTTSASVLEATPMSSQFIVEVNNDLLDRMIDGPMRQVIDDPVNPISMVSRLQCWNLSLKTSVDLGMRF